MSLTCTLEYLRKYIPKNIYHPQLQHKNQNNLVLSNTRLTKTSKYLNNSLLTLVRFYNLLPENLCCIADESQQENILQLKLKVLLLKN